jgi:KRAB domain-containing zinc finger protein
LKLKEDHEPEEEFNKNPGPRIHLRPNADGLYECQYCGKIFTAANSIYGHLAVHIEKYKCRTCGKCFQSKFYLKAHRLTHEDRKLEKPEDSPFKCNICLKTFKAQIGLTKHMRLVMHNRDEEKVFKCDKCGFSTNYKKVKIC